jgi:glucuronate isomerase
VGDMPIEPGAVSIKGPAPDTAEVGGELVLHEDRFFSPVRSIRRIARELYEETRALPLICPHGHVDPSILAVNDRLPEPTALLIVPDHYIVRMLYSGGVSMESLGIPTRDGAVNEGSPRAAWQVFADHFYLFRGTPTGAWLRYQLHQTFGVHQRLTGETAQAIYDEIAEKLHSPEFRPRALFEQFNIEVLATTDAATDALTHHQGIRDSGWRGKVIPTFRPDALFRIAAPGWPGEVQKLELACGYEISSYSSFVRALEERRRFFRSLGATSTDHAVVEPHTEHLSEQAVELLFQRALRGASEDADQRRFEGHMLIEMARMSTEDGMVMQLHPGALRNHNQAVFDRYGPDRGADIPVATEYTRNLQPLLNAYGNDRRLTLILFTLDESTYARELAPLAGHYPAVRIGSPWWFHDSIDGMRSFLERTTETAGIYNSVGFNDDGRACCSIPARHDLARRVQANWLAGMVARHVIDGSDAHELAHALAYSLAREAYKLGGVD